MDVVLPLVDHVFDVWEPRMVADEIAEEHQHRQGIVGNSKGHHRNVILSWLQVGNHRMWADKQTTKNKS